MRTVIFKSVFPKSRRERCERWERREGDATTHYLAIMNESMSDRVTIP
jgi:hypothetical protein